MHYIRFLKLPKLAAPKTASKNTYDLSAKLTITNDLGELFLTTAQQLECILLVHLNQTQKQRHIYQCEWQPRSRALEINFTISAKYLRDVKGNALPCELIVQSLSNEKENVSARGNVAKTIYEEGRIVSVYSEKFGLDGIGAFTATVRRLLTLNGDQEVTIIREEKGESIARHIWDAGLVLSEFLRPITQGKSEDATKLRLVSTVLTRNDLKAIELGTGVGLVGLALADVLADGEHGSAKIVLTDLDDAKEIVEINMAEKLKHKSNIAVEFTELDWTKPLPPSIEDEHWDLVLIADCTYNPDYAQALANTIKSLLMPKGQDAKPFENRKPLALLAMKPRHTAEDVFFEYMAQAGVQCLEEVRVPVQVLGSEAQEIRILGFGLP